MISQENLLLQVHVLEAKNEMYYETILKMLSELNKANDKVACLSFWYWKICRKCVLENKCVTKEALVAWKKVHALWTQLHKLWMNHHM